MEQSKEVTFNSQLTHTKVQHIFMPSLVEIHPIDSEEFDDERIDNKDLGDRQKG